MVLMIESEKINILHRTLTRINNCVGELNQKYFLQFLVYTGVTCLYGSLVVFISWQLEEGDEEGVPLSEYRQNRLIHTVSAGLELDPPKLSVARGTFSNIPPI